MTTAPGYTHARGRAHGYTHATLHIHTLAAGLPLSSNALTLLSLTTACSPFKSWVSLPGSPPGMVRLPSFLWVPSSQQRQPSGSVLSSPEHCFRRVPDQFPTLTMLSCPLKSISSQSPGAASCAPSPARCAPHHWLRHHQLLIKAYPDSPKGRQGLFWP